MKQSRLVVLLGATLLSASVWAEPLQAVFVDPAWDGVKVPAEHNCEGAAAKTPALKVSGIPAESDYLTLAFRDLDGPGQMSRDGGHGKLGFVIQAGAGEAVLPAVAQGLKKNQMPEGVELLAEHRGRRPVDGYLAPCSQGRNHRYEVVVRAVTAADKDKPLAEFTLPMGNW